MLVAKELLAHAMAPVYRVINGLLVVTVFMVVGLWLSGNGTNAGAFDLARILVPDEARHMVWSNGFEMLNQQKDSSEIAAAPASDTEIAAVIYNKSKLSATTGLASAKQQTVALLMPSVAQMQVKSISHLSDRIPTSKIDPQALDSNLMGSLQNQRAVADFFEKKYSLDRSKIEEYVSNTILIAKEVNIRVGAYILKYLIATAGSLRNGLKYYVGAANAEDDGGYADKVMAERNRLISLCQNRSTNRLTLNGKDIRS